MKCAARKGWANARAMSLVELMFAVAVGGVVIAAAVSVWMFVARSFVAVGNYADLDGKSRFTVDSMLRDIRQASAVVGYQKNGTNNWMSLTNSQIAGSLVTYTWNKETRRLMRQKPNEGDFVYLTECDLWDFQLYQRTPQSNGVYLFFPATNSLGAPDTNICKLINMTWKCSRTILGKKVNTENMQTAQVVLRNKR